MTMSAFNDQLFEKKLLALKDSQESISSLSDWCLQHKQHHKKIVSTWLHVFKRVKVENRLTLFYLANDVIQYSKRKNYEFVESWGTALQKATTMVRDEKVLHRILRIFTIWGDRNVYDDAFLTDLRGLLLTVKKATPASTLSQTKQPEPPPQPAPVVFEPHNLFLKINKCKELEDDTDLKLKAVNDCNLKLNDLDAFRKSLKDRRHADGVAGELDEAIKQMEQYKKALEVEILERKAVIELLHHAEKFYETERGEAKIVFNAYRNFGSRVKSLKRKLDERIPTLASPIPSPDVNAPSPSPDSDLDLPNDDDLSGKAGANYKKNAPTTTTISYQPNPEMGDMDGMPNCFSSFMGGGSLPFEIQGNLFTDERNNMSCHGLNSSFEDEIEGKPIEVISRRKEEDNFDITNFLKNLAQGPPIPTKSKSSAGIPGLGDPLPVPPPPPVSVSAAAEYEHQHPSPPASAPLLPPPVPPGMFDGYAQDGRERDDSWNTSLPPKFPTWRDTSESNWTREESSTMDGGDWMPALPVSKVPPPPASLPLNHETPESPPNFEKESFRDPVEYDDTGLDRSSTLSGGDVDHRLFQKDVDHRVLNSRFKKDVDHRNLISLTGSPHEVQVLQPPPMPPSLWGDADQDYRTIPMPPRQQSKARQAGDIVESVDMEMSDEEDGDHHKEKTVRSSDESPLKKLNTLKTDSPPNEKEDGKNKSPRFPSSHKQPQALPLPHPHVINNQMPPTLDFSPPVPPCPGFPLSPALRPDFSNFPNSQFSIMPGPPLGPPPGIPLSNPPPGVPIRSRHPSMPPCIPPPPPSLPRHPPPNAPVVLPPRPMLLEMPAQTLNTPPGQHPNTQQGTPTGATSSGPEESDTDSIGQYLNMGLSDDEEIKEMVASMDPQMLQEVVENMSSIGNGSEKTDNNLVQSNGEVLDNESEWSAQNNQIDLMDMNNRALGSGIRPWKHRQGGPGPGPGTGTPTGPPGSPRFRGQPANWRPPQMHDRGGFGRGRGWGFRPFRPGGPRGGPRQQFGGW